MSPNSNNISYRFPFIRILTDFIVIFVSAVLAFFIRFESFTLSNDYIVATLIPSIIMVSYSLLSKRYEETLNKTKYILASRTLLSWMLALGSVLFVSFLTKTTAGYSRLWVLYWFLIASVLLILWTVLHWWMLSYVARKGFGVRRILVVGDGSFIAKSLDDINVQSKFGCKIAETIKFGEGLEENYSLIDTLDTRVAASSIDEVWICLPLKDGDYISKVTYSLRHSTVEIRFIPQMDDLNLLNHKPSYVAGFYAIDLSCSPLSGVSQYVKRAEDVLVTMALLPIIVPACIGISILIRFSSPGAVLFKQQRHGLNGKPIKVYKFRTMTSESSSSGSVVQATQNDTRITKVGKFLRKTSLDELPQFFNVLQGRMSIVGPRPHALEHNEYYKDLMESYMWRHKVKPGITGWAQVNGFRGETDTVEKMKNRVDADLWYIENWSLRLDLKIIFLTVVKGFFDENAY